MASDTKDRICEVALKLFNERGYASVSLRDIAAEAGIAIGSLTYHFSRKEDLLEKMLVDLHTGFGDMFDQTLEGTDLLAHLLDLFVAAHGNQERFPFYFQNISQIMLESETLRAESAAFEQKLARYYESAFGKLSRGGVLTLPEGACAHALAVSIVGVHACWKTAACPASNGAVEPISVDASLAGVLGCVVAEEHRAEYRALCAERGIAL